jgi:hypothetical protein
VAIEPDGSRQAQGSTAEITMSESGPGASSLPAPCHIKRSHPGASGSPCGGRPPISAPPGCWPPRPGSRGSPWRYPVLADEPDRSSHPPVAAIGCTFSALHVAPGLLSRHG